MNKFYLTYKDIKTQIELEPIGFDAFATTIERSDTSHGISIEYSDTDLQFDDSQAIEILKTAYSDDINSLVIFTFEVDGVDVYTGAIDFANYSEVYEGKHYILTRIADIGVRSAFFARIEQEVNIDNLTAFDGAALSKYPSLEKDIYLPAVEMLYTSNAARDEPESMSKTYEFHNNFYDVYKVSVGDTATNEIENFMPLANNLMGIDSTWQGADFGEKVYHYNDATFVFDQQAGFDSGKIFKIKIKFYIDIKTYSEWAFRIEIRHNPDGGLKETLYSQYGTGGGNAFDLIKVDLDVERNLDINNQIVISFFNRRLTPFDGQYPSPTGTFYFNVSESSIKISAINKTAGSNAKVSMVHESLSRIVEACTNGTVSVKSDYYGRVYSNINKTPVNGPGSLRALTTGLRIRNKANAQFAISFKKIFESLQPVDNIGYGFVREDDKTYMRVEPYEWFFSDENIILEVEDPIYKKIIFDTDDVISTFNVGYKKYETEGTNGSDAFLTERTYRTRQTITSTNFEQISDFIADGYAIEATRRRMEDTSDWRYDSDVFIIQLLLENIVEQGVGSSENLIGPNTVYNARISPARCARRWLNRLFGWSDKNETLIFTSGTGNINAKTEIGEDVIVENADLSTQIIPSYVKKSEIIEFEYPLTIEQYNAIIKNPYGRIVVDGTIGYLKSIAFPWKTQIATIQIYPIYQTYDTLLVTEDKKYYITTEDNYKIRL